VVHRPVDINAFEFAVMASLRAVQLMRGCTPRVEGATKVAVIAQMEIAERRIVRELKTDSKTDSKAESKRELELEAVAT
jgi:DNA-directed RNA polymerase subunit K/omega